MADLDKEFVEYVVKSLVSNPDAVQVERSVDDRGVLLELTVDSADMGKVIGKAGATAKSLRTLLRVLGAKNDAKVNLKIVEPEGSERPERSSEESHDEPVDAVESEEVNEETEAEEEPTSDIRAKTEAELKEIADLEF